MDSKALQLIQTQYQSDSECESSDPQIHISSASSSSSWSLSSTEDTVEDKHLIEGKTEEKEIKTKVKTKGELSLEDLPPIEKLSISVGAEELTQIGSVDSIVDQLVIVRSFRSMPALDLDSVLFLKDGQPLGQIFDVLGPVVEPRYAVRFDSSEQITERQICVQTPVYFAAQMDKPITGFVFLSQLRQMKGSDASWKHNNEPPEDVIEYSDDESERLAKQRAKVKRTRSEAMDRGMHDYSHYRVPPNTPNTPKVQNSEQNTDTSVDYHLNPNCFQN